MNPVDELNFLLGIGPPRPVLPITLQKSGYTSVKSLGKGSFGQALLLFHKGKQQYYVAKHVNLTNMNTRQRRDAHNEITVLQQMHHPNIIRYVECFEEHPHLYIVMEYADGGDLFSHLQRITKLKLPYEFKNKSVLRSLRTGPLTEAQVISLFIQTMMALKYMHDRRILHRDIKSQNVFLTKNHVVKLGDFGITTILQNTVAMASTMCGTPCYFSPELCRGEAYNNKSDIWAAGVLLYEMTSIHLPFESTTMKALMREIVSKEPRRIPPSYSDELWFLIKSMLQKDPRQRPDAAAVLRTPVLMRQIPDIITLLRNTETDSEIVNLLNSHTISSLCKYELSTTNSKPIQTKDNRQQDIHAKICENVHDVNNNKREAKTDNNNNDNNNGLFAMADKNISKAANVNNKVSHKLKSPLLEEEQKKIIEVRKTENHQGNGVITPSDKTTLRNVHKNVVQINMQRQRAEIKDLLARFDKAKERVSGAKKLSLNNNRIVDNLDCKENCKEPKGVNKGEERVDESEEELNEPKLLQQLTPGAAAALAAQEHLITENNVEDDKVSLEHDDISNAICESNELTNRTSLNEELDEMIKEMSNHFSQFEISQKQNSQHLKTKNEDKNNLVLSSSFTTKSYELMKSNTPNEANEFINDEFIDNAGNVLNIEQLQAILPKESNKKNMLFHSELPLKESECQWSEEEQRCYEEKNKVKISQEKKIENKIEKGIGCTLLEKEESGNIDNKINERRTSLTNKCVTQTPELTATALINNNNNLMYNTSCLCGHTQFCGTISSIYGSFVCNCAACVHIGCNAAGIEWLHLPEVEEVTNLLECCNVEEQINMEKDVASAAGTGVSAATVLGSTQQERKVNTKNVMTRKNSDKCDKPLDSMLEKFIFTMRLEVESNDKPNDSDNDNDNDDHGCACRSEYYDGEFTTFFCKRCGICMALLHDDMPGILLAKTTLDAKSTKILEEFAHTVSNTEEDLTETSCSNNNNKKCKEIDAWVKEEAIHYKAYNL